MTQTQIDPYRMLMVTSWVATVGLLVAAWSHYLMGRPDAALMFGLTCCVTTGIACVAQVRCYMVGMAALLRESREFDLLPADLRAIRH